MQRRVPGETQFESPKESGGSEIVRMNSAIQRLLSRIDSSEFIGRERELDILTRFSELDRRANRLVLSAEPFSGSTELLRQLYDHLFSDQTGTIPIYFTFFAEDNDFSELAERFLRESLRQFVAARRRDGSIVKQQFGFDESLRSASASDRSWLETLSAACDEARKHHHSDIETFFSLPARAAEAGIGVMVIIDDVHQAASVSEGEAGLLRLLRFLEVSGIPHIIGGRRRFVSRLEDDRSLKLDLNALSFSATTRLVDSLASRHSVSISAESRDLMAVQFGGRPPLISAFLNVAAIKGLDLLRFRDFEKLYSEEICGGTALRSFELLFEPLFEIIPARDLFRILKELEAAGAQGLDQESLRKAISLAPDSFRRILDHLNQAQIVSLTSGFVKFEKDWTMMGDYVSAKHSLEISGASRELALGRIKLQMLKRSPLLMQTHYRKSSALDLKHILSRFDLQRIPRPLFDYGLFKEELKGLSQEEILSELSRATEHIIVPEIVHSVHAESISADMAKMAPREMAAIGFGFNSAFYGDKDDVVWIAAEIRQKLEVGRELTEVWCKHLTDIAKSCEFERFQVWLIASEGFDQEAMSFLEAASFLSSSRRQMEFLISLLHEDKMKAAVLPSGDYELAIPFSEESELIAVQALEEVARRHSYPMRAINQIKTAVVEAIINAKEHSLSPDGKIHQRFSVTDERIVVTLQNRGLRPEIPERQDSDTSGRRGWGLKLMRTLMDEVVFHETDDGTRITMTKMRPR